MIKVKFTYDKRQHRVVLEVRGHAEFAPQGEDIICAGASILAVTAGSMAKNLFWEDMLKRKPQVILRPGYCLVAASIREGFEAEVLMSFWTMQVGFHELEKLYPDYVELEEVLEV